MSLINEDFTLKCLTGQPVLFEDICALYPATLRDISRIGYSKFQLYLSIWTMSKPVISEGNEMKDFLMGLSDFQYLILMACTDKEVLQNAKEGFKFFTREDIIFSPKSEEIIVGPIEEKHIIKEEEFMLLQSCLKHMYFIDNGQEEIIINKDDDARVREIKRKLLERRRKLAAAKAQQNGSSDIEFSDLISSLAVGNIGLNISNIWDITYYAFHDQLKRMEWREQFNINNRAALAGAKIDKEQLKHWIRSIKSDNN